MRRTTNETDEPDPKGGKPEDDLKDLCFGPKGTLERDFSDAFSGWFESIARRVQRENAPGVPVAAPLSDGPLAEGDYTRVRWKRTVFVFSRGRQADAVRVLWEARGKGLSNVEIADGMSLGESATERFRLVVTLRIRDRRGKMRPHPAMGSMVTDAGKGAFRIVRRDRARSQ